MSLVSTTVNQFGTKIERYLDLHGNFPVSRRKYIPSEGSKFQKVGISEITKFRSPYPGENNTYSVVRNGLRNNYTLEGLKNLVKELGLSKISGHKTKDLLGYTQRITLGMIKKGKF